MLTKPIDMKIVLNNMYKNLPVGSIRKVENFNNKRKITVYRGKDFLNKTTVKLKTSNSPFVMLVNNMKNIGTKYDPELVTQKLHLRTDVGDAFIYIDKYLHGVDGVHVEAYRRGVYVEPFQKAYKSLMDVRKDKDFQYIIDVLTGKIKNKNLE